MIIGVGSQGPADGTGEPAKDLAAKAGHQAGRHIYIRAEVPTILLPMGGKGAGVMWLTHCF